MKRPLALFGFAFLATQLACALFLQKSPPWAVAALAALFAVGGLALFAAGAAKRAPQALVLLAAAAVGLAWQWGWQQLVLAPAGRLAGGPVPVQALILRVEQPKEGELAQTDLALISAGGQRLPRRVPVRVSRLPVRQPGELIELELSLYEAGSYDRGRGFLLRGVPRSELRPVGTSRDIGCYFARLQQRLSRRLQRAFTPRVGAVAAAVCTGDRSALPDRLRSDYQRAGVSHLLVVSGLHLTLLTQLLGGLLPPGRKKLRAAVLCLSVAGMMALAGFTPSVNRAGIVALVLLAAEFFGQAADPLTSLGFAALLLTAANPAAALDLGLLLSFSATLGIQGGNALRLQLKARGVFDRRPLLGRAVGALLPPAFAGLAPLPVLIASGSGISLFSLLSNILLVPLAAPLLASGLLTALTAGIPLLTIPHRAAALCCGLLVRFWNGFTGAVGSLPFGVVHLQGLYPLVILLCVFGLAAFLACGLSGAARRRAAAGGAVFLLAAAALGSGLEAGTLRVALVGYNQQPAVVVSCGRQAAVLWRGGRTNTGAVRDYLESRGVTQLSLLVNAATDGSAEQFAAAWPPQQRYDAAQDKGPGRSFQLFGGACFTVRRWGAGVLYLLEIEGYRLACATGCPDMTGLPPVDVFLAGTRQPPGLRAGCILAGSRQADWVFSCGLPVRQGEQPVLWLRPGRSVKYLGVEQDVGFGSAGAEQGDRDKKEGGGLAALLFG